MLLSLEYYRVMEQWNAGRKHQREKPHTHRKHRNGSLRYNNRIALHCMSKFEEFDDIARSVYAFGSWKPIGPTPAPSAGETMEGGKVFVPGKPKEWIQDLVEASMGRTLCDVTRFFFRLSRNILYTKRGNTRYWNFPYWVLPGEYFAQSTYWK